MPLPSAIIFMNGIKRTFALTALTILLLLLLHELPSPTLLGTGLRKVDIISELAASPQSDATNGSQRKEGKDIKGDAADYCKDIPHSIPVIDDYGGTSGTGMVPLYKALILAKATNDVVRIAYFGDSFIEGDMFTCDLREQLQQHFGGQGPGWIDAGSRFNEGFRRTIKQHYKGIREFSVVESPFEAALQGLNQRYFIPSEGAVLSTRGTSHSPHASTWEQTKLFVRTSGRLNVSTTLAEKPAVDHSFSTSSGLQTYTVKGKTGSVEFRFHSLQGRNVLYGMALEGKSGVVLDSYSMRGSAGFSLATVPMQTLKDFAKLRPVHLFVLHFGLNVATARTTKEDYDIYIRKMYDVIHHLHEAFPDAGFLVVSVTDRSQRSQQGITTMEGLEYLIGCQQQMAKDCNIAFFNLFQAMGGKGSMAKLVDRGLANKDYTHINFDGGRELSKLLFDAIRTGYDDYQQWLSRQ